MWPVWTAIPFGLLLGFAIGKVEDRNKRQRAEIIRLETEKCNTLGGFYGPETGCQILKKPIVEYLR